MYPKCLLTFQLLAILLVVDSLALSCIPCYMLKCSEHLRCPGGKVMDECSCCPQCAMMKYESCGGPYDHYGTCDEGLECVKRGPIKFNAVGVCQEAFLVKLMRLRK